VGAGQSEVDIARLAQTTIVVEVPGLGDDIQASKAGILEIADILVVNKADTPGAESTERALRNMLELAHPDGDMPDGKAGWVPPILNTVATTATGIEAVVEAVHNHRVYLKESGEWQKREQARLLFELNALLQSALVSRWRSSIADSEYKAVLDAVLQRRLSTFSAVDRLLNIKNE
ncbi:MAG: methylmalonyl Co-A mutase-associated GTPase MeaB, partial [Anaerolineaceae bacterium]|nr:methylmalonyl Co-A mutase-associated GTPase MeaB [Anaerolineaceae bacterium]